MTPDMSPATRVDAVTVAVPLAADTEPMAIWRKFWVLKKEENKNKN